MRTLDRKLLRSRHTQQSMGRWNRIRRRSTLGVGKRDATGADGPVQGRIQNRTSVETLQSHDRPPTLRESPTPNEGRKETEIAKKRTNVAVRPSDTISTIQVRGKFPKT